MALNIRKVIAQQANYNQNNYEKCNFYIILIEIAFFACPRTLCPVLFYNFIN